MKKLVDLRMTETAYILADLALLKIPINTPFRIQGPLNNITIDLHDKYSPEIIGEMNQIIINQPRLIEKFLVEQKYIDVIENSTALCNLSVKGEKAQELGGHRAYIKWEAKEKRKTKWTDLPP